MIQKLSTSLLFLFSISVFGQNADTLLNECITAHGGDLYKTANYSFVFRGNTYKFRNDNSQYEYEVLKTKKGKVTKDILNSNGFNRIVNNEKVTLSKREISKHSNALNSVIYFATLPNKLNDKAVLKEYQGTQTIQNKNYDVLKIYFQKDGGGNDHDDTFMYWINSVTKKIDYLAYMYNVNGGGVRFRSAYNRRVIGGITFQDYINYKAPVNTPLKKLPNLFEKGKLKELSRIATETIINLHKNTSMENNGLITKKSNYDFDTTYQKIKNILEGNPNLKILLELDHSKNAASKGLELNPTRIILFGNPNLGTPLMQTQPSVAIDLPQKILVIQDDNGAVNVIYNDPIYLEKRHGIEGKEEILSKISGALNKITDLATQ